jgi:hypothetical protein
MTRQYFPGSFILTADLKLARFPARSPLPVAALPSMSLIPLSSIRGLNGF